MSIKSICLILFIYFVVFLIFRTLGRKYNSNYLNKSRNILVYLGELFIAGTLFNIIFNKETFLNQSDFFLIIKDYVFANTVYTILINIILRFWDGTTIDSYTSFQYMIKKLKIAAVYSDKECERLLMFFIEKYKFLESKGSNNLDTKIIYDNVIFITSEFLAGKVSEKTLMYSYERYLIEIEHSKNIVSLGWYTSLTLRFFK